MNHYTLNSGHNRNSPLEEVDRSVFPTLWKLIESYRSPLPKPLSRYSWWKAARITPGLTFAIHHGSNTLAICGVAETMEEVLSQSHFLVAAYNHVRTQTLWGKLPHLRISFPEPPWLAVVIAGPPDEIMACDWLGDFERCVAWAWLERPKGPVMSAN